MYFMWLVGNVLNSSAIDTFETLETPVHMVTLRHFAKFTALFIKANKLEAFVAPTSGPFY